MCDSAFAQVPPDQEGCAHDCKNGAMKKTPRKAGRTAQPGSRFLVDVVAANVRDHRALRRISQDQLAGAMAAMGHGWSRATVSLVELGDRNVTVDELAALSFALFATIPELLDPAGVEGRSQEAIDLGWSDQPLPQPQARDWLAGRVRWGIFWADGVPAPDSYLVAPVEGHQQEHKAAAQAVTEMGRRSVAAKAAAKRRTK